MHTFSLSQSEFEAVVMEYNFVIGDVVMALNNLDDWATPKPQPKDLLNKFNSVYIQPEPYGVVLNISAWNFPIQLSLCPVVGAIAAGEPLSSPSTSFSLSLFQ